MADLDEEYIAKMEDVLEVYERPYGNASAHGSKRIDRPVNGCVRCSSSDRRPLFLHHRMKTPN